MKQFDVRIEGPNGHLYYELHGFDSESEARDYALKYLEEGVTCLYFYNNGKKFHEFKNAKED